MLTFSSLAQCPKRHKRRKRMKILAPPTVPIITLLDFDVNACSMMLLLTQPKCETFHFLINCGETSSRPQFPRNSHISCACLEEIALRLISDFYLPEHRRSSYRGTKLSLISKPKQIASPQFSLLSRIFYLLIKISRASSRPVCACVVPESNSPPNGEREGRRSREN